MSYRAIAGIFAVMLVLAVGLLLTGKRNPMSSVPPRFAEAPAALSTGSTPADVRVAQPARNSGDTSMNLPSPEIVDSPAPADLPAGWLTSRVVDASGQPISGAEVYAIGADPSGIRSVIPTARTRSDRSGRWRLAVEDHRVGDVAAVAEGYVAAVQSGVSFDPLRDHALPDFLLLEPGSIEVEPAEISGHVLDREGRPVERIRVSRRGGGRAERAVTGEAGEFRFSGLLPGLEYTLVAEAPRLVETSGIGADAERSVIAPAVGVELRLTATVLRITARDAATGEPITGFQLGVRAPGSETTIAARDADRVVLLDRVELPEGAWIRIGAIDYEPRSLEAAALAGLDDVTIDLSPVPETTKGRFQLSITDETGRAVPTRNVCVELCREDDWQALRANLFAEPIPVDLADDTLSLCPGRYTIWVSFPQSFGLSTSAEFEVRERETTIVPIVRRLGGGVVVEVRGRDGRFIDYGNVELQHETGARGQVWSTHTRWPEMHWRADHWTGILESPTFVSELIPPGTYTFAIECPGYEPRTEVVVVQPGEVTPVAIVLSPER